jgi:ribonuclease-3
MLSRLVKKFKNRKSEKILSRFLNDTKIAELESKLDYKIKNKHLFIQALVHRSYLEESKEPIISNERLEFLGDAVLNLIVADYLYTHFSENDEGFLTKVRARIVNRRVLADAAESLDLVDFIILGKNLIQSFKNGSKSVLSDAFEAIIGAIYLDSGFEETTKFVNRILIKPISKKDDFLQDENYKSQLLEFAQSKRMENPSYNVVSEEGPQHNRTFTIKVFIGNVEYGIGKGRNKKSAEQDAAKAAMIKLLEEN